MRSIVLEDIYFNEDLTDKQKAVQQYNKDIEQIFCVISNTYVDYKYKNKEYNFKAELEYHLRESLKQV